MKVKQNVNKQKILQLLESSNSVEQHVYYQKGENPEKIQQYYLGPKGQGIVGGKSTLALLNQPRVEEVRSKYSFSEKKTPNILRTIYMPNYEVDGAKEQIEAIRKEIAEEKQYYLDVMKSLQDEKIQYEDEQRAHYLVLKEKYDEVLKQLHEKEAYNSAIVKDHIELKHVYELEERAKNEENEAIRQENLGLRNQIRALACDTNKSVKLAKTQYEKNAEEFGDKFRAQIRQHSENMSMIRDQYHKLSAVYKKKLELLKDKQGKERLKLDQKSSKRTLDLEGFQSDLQNLEKRIVFYQNYIGKLKKLVDRDARKFEEEYQENFHPNGMGQDVIMEMGSEDD